MTGKLSYDKTDDVSRLKLKYFQALIENSMDAIMVLDANGIIKYESPSIERMLGYKQGERYGKNALDFVAAGSMKHATEVLAYVLQNAGSVKQVDINVLHKDGSWRIVEIRARNLIENPTVRGIVANFRDITQSKQAEEALRESEEKYQKVVSISPVGISIYDASGQCVDANDSITKIVGATKEQVLQQNYNHIKSWKRSGLLDIAKRAVKEQSTKQYELVVDSTFGKPVRLDCYLVPFSSGGLLLMVTDVTARILAEEALKKSEAYYKEAQRVAHIGHWELDPVIGIPVWSDEIFRIFGLNPQEGEPSVTNLENLIHPDDWPSLNEAITIANTEGIPYEMSFRIVQPDGAIRWMHSIGTTFKNEQGKVIKQFGTAQDITERKNSEIALKESEEFSNSLLENSLNPILVLNRDSSIRYVNPKLESLTGYSSEELIGRKAPFPWWTDDLRSGDINVRRISILKGGHSDEVVFQKKNGEIFWVEINTTPIEQNGETQYALTTWIDITERKRKEEALRVSEERYQEIFNGSRDGFVIVDTEGRFLDANISYCRMLGFTIEELREKKDFYEITPEKWREWERKEIWNKRLLKKGYSGIYEKEYINKDGTIIPIEIQSYAAKNESGVQYLWGVARDITKRKNAEKALRESEEFSTSLLQSSPTPILVVNPDGSLRYVNPSLEKLTGYSSRELIGSKPPFPWWILELETKSIDERLEDIIKGSERLEKLCRNKDGDHFWVDVIPSPVMQDGEHIYTLVNWIDITKRKQAELALQESDERLKLALDSVSDAVWDWRVDTGDVYFSSRWYTMLGYEPYQLPQAYDTWRELLHPDDLVHAEQTVLKHLELAKPFELEIRMKTKDNQWKWILARGKTVEKDENGKALRMLGTHMDITDRKRLEAQLQQSQKMESIGTLAGGIAHDFNNILSPIMVHSELALMDLSTDSPIQHNLKEIFKAGERARDLVKQILTFSRKEEGKQAKIKIIPILIEVLKMLRSSIPTTIDIHKNLEAISDTILADPTHIQQIMLNLATNSAYAMREKGGILKVSLIQEDFNYVAAAKYSDLKPGSYLRLTVSDTGTGIEDETMKRIFEPYFTTKMTGEGTGMGLAMVHGIVKSYDGDITVESTLGKGTTFNVYLPRIEGEEVASVAEPAVQLPKGSGRILFVDDEKTSVDVMQAMLGNLGYKVTARTSSIEALEVFKNDPNRFDLVITDMTMPNMTGKELSKEIMSIRPGIPVILCTGFSEQIGERRAKELGISAFLMKPIIMRDIAITIREVLDKK